MFHYIRRETHLPLRYGPCQQRRTSNNCKAQHGWTGGRRGAWTRTCGAGSPASSRPASGY
eukprot:4528244-Prymnesium_polylepis.1